MIKAFKLTFIAIAINTICCCAACKAKIRTDDPGLTRTCAVAEFCARNDMKEVCGPAIIACTRLAVYLDCEKDDKCVLQNR